MTDAKEDGYAVVRSMLGPEVEELMRKSAASDAFAGEIGELSVENVFGRLWSREGLGRRERSLVTLGILIALRATEEMQYHFPLALKNGLTRDELAEVIYHASGYAGFPAAATAALVGQKIFDGKTFE
jgi:4-carboxymuconolactone decarboxylase